MGTIPDAVALPLKQSRGWLRRAVLRGVIRPDFPATLNVEPTSLCNVRCVVCPTKQRPMGYMDLALFERLLEESRRYGRRLQLTLHKDGEPLLHPELPRMIRMAKERRVAWFVTLNSNGTLLDDRLGAALLESGLDEVVISLGATTAGTYRELKQVGGFEETEERIRAFLERKRRSRRRRPRVRMMMIRDSSVTAGEVDEYVARWRPLCDGVMLDGFVNWAGAIAPALGAAPRPPLARHPCDYLWYTCAVQWDGRVARCVYDHDAAGAIGDLREQSLAEIWQGEVRRRLLARQLAGTWDGPCRTCDCWTKTVALGPWLKRVTPTASASS